MESQLFDDLLQQALRREAPVINVAYQLWRSVEDSSISRAGRIAVGLIEADTQFNDELARLAREGGWRVRQKHPVQQLLEVIFKPPEGP